MGDRRPDHAFDLLFLTHIGWDRYHFNPTGPKFRTYLWTFQRSGGARPPL
jgi:hypothetical protein